MFLEGKTALVTGSTSGIGLGIAAMLAGAGARVMINGLGERAMIDEALAQVGNNAAYSDADMTDPAAIEAMVRTCGERLGANEPGGPDILVNNAGIQHVAPVDAFPLDKWDAIIAVILTSTFQTCRAAIPGMRAKGWGRIINTGSAHSLVASPNKAPYVAAKHAVAGFTKAVALELAQTGVTANVVSPGYVWTGLIEKQIPDTMATRGLSREAVINDVLLAAQPTKQFVTVDQVASLVLYLCRDEAAAITGANLSIDGGWTAQ